MSGDSRPIAAYWMGPMGSKAICFQGEKFTVFQWQHDVLLRMLAPHGETFDLPQWYRTLDARCLRRGILVPQFDETGRWLYQETLNEAVRRGFEVAQLDKERFSPQSLRLRAAYQRVMMKAKLRA